MGDPGEGGKADYKTAFDPFAKRESRIPATATIKEIYPAVMMEKPDTLDNAANGWTAFEKQLSASSADLDKHYGKLKPQWTSDAATVFFGWVDSTKASLSDWQQAAKANAAALHTLAGNIRRLQTHMTQLWNEFTAGIAAAQAQEDGTDWNPGELFRDIGEWGSPTTRLDPVLEKYTNKTVSEVLNPLNNAYKDAFLATYPGSVFTGPTNAQKPTDKQIAAAFGAPGGPPGSPGSPPASPGAAPAPPGARPAPPGAPPAPPGAPPAPLGAPPAPLAGLAPPIAPKAPAPLPPAPLPAGLAPSALPAPSALNQPLAPRGAPPGLGGTSAPLGLGPAGVAPLGLRPGGTAPKGAPPASFGEQGPVGGSAPSRPAAPEMPRGLQGRGSNGASNSMPEPPPGSGMRNPPPQLPGRGGGGGGKPNSLRPGTPGSEMPEMPPPGRGMPALPGRNGKKPGQFDEADPMRPGASGDSVPPNPGRFGSPRSLQGIRNPKTGIRPGSPEAEELPLRRLPTLDGRVGLAGQLAEEEMESTLQALRQGLGGRGMLRPDRPGEVEAAESRPSSSTPSRPARSRAKREQVVKQEAPGIDFVGDSELFTPEAAAPAVIERPAEPRPVSREDPALRPGPADPSLA